MNSSFRFVLNATGIAILADTFLILLVYFTDKTGLYNQWIWTIIPLTAFVLFYFITDKLHKVSEKVLVKAALITISIITLGMNWSGKGDTRGKIATTVALVWMLGFFFLKVKPDFKPKIKEFLFHFFISVLLFIATLFILTGTQWA